jgi:adenylate cyclase
MDPERIGRGLRLVSRALEIDPRYCFAATLAGNATSEMLRQDGRPIRSRKLQKDCGFSGWHSAIDGNATLALSMLGRATAGFSGDFDTAREMVDRAVSLETPIRSAHGRSEVGLPVAGQPEEASEL